MILDDLENINKYLALHPRFVRAFDYLNTTKFEDIKPGNYDIDGDDIYAIVVNDEAVAMLDSTAQFECHNTYRPF
jgi:YhcH/YjgK/YiaL family protein